MENGGKAALLPFGTSSLLSDSILYGNFHESNNPAAYKSRSTL
jgi:hypothetical protein